MRAAFGLARKLCTQPRVVWRLITMVCEGRTGTSFSSPTPAPERSIPQSAPGLPRSAPSPPRPERPRPARLPAPVPSGPPGGTRPAGRRPVRGPLVTEPMLGRIPRGRDRDDPPGPAFPFPSLGPTLSRPIHPPLTIPDKEIQEIPDRICILQISGQNKDGGVSPQASLAIRTIDEPGDRARDGRHGLEPA